MISVAICTYNGEKYIKEQLLSIINQTKKVDELIVCDDNSSDNTIKIVKDILEKYRVNYKIYINESNIGVSNNFFKAINYCTGDIILTCDQDDVWLDNKVEHILEEFDKDEDIVLVFSDAYIVDENLIYLGYNLSYTLGVKLDAFSNENFYKEELKRNIVCGATMAFKKKFVEKIKPLNSELWIHDGWIAMNAFIYGKVSFIKKPLIKYRQHKSNVLGGRRQNLLHTIRYFIKDIDKVNEIRKIRLQGYNYFYNINKNVIDKHTSFEIKRCICFWEDLNRIVFLNRLESINIIFKNILNKNYARYYNGYRSAIKDIVYLLIK